MRPGVPAQAEAWDVYSGRELIGRVIRGADGKWRAAHWILDSQEFCSATTFSTRDEANAFLMNGGRNGLRPPAS
jgi:hypothetical protein